MKQDEPQIVTTAKYSIGEVAEILGVTTATINRWTANGMIHAGRRRVNGRRYWTGAEILRAWNWRFRCKLTPLFPY